MPKITAITVHDGPAGPAGTNIYVQPGDPGAVPDGTLWLDTDDTTPDTSLNWGDIAGTLSNQTDLNTALAAKAPLASPALTGTPTAPTATAGTNTTQLATTAFVLANGSAAAAWGSITGTLSSQTDLNTALNAKAPLASPTFTGTPAAPTAAAATNTTQIATTAYVQTNLGSYLTTAAAASTYAPLASPTLTGTPAAPTAATATNTTQIATTAYVQANVTPLAPLASPAFTGTPTAPTAANGTNTTQLATTAFVLANGGSGSSPLTTKGDLYGYSTTGARVPVGTDGQVLAADGTQSAGVSYADRRRPIPFISGNFYTVWTHGTGMSAGTGNANAAAANTLTLVFIELPAAISVTSIQVRVNTATASGNVRVGLFSYIFSTGVATLLVDGGTQSTATTGNKTFTIASTALAAGWLAVGILPDTSVTLAGGNPIFGFGQNDLGGSPWAGRTVAVTYGAFAGPYTTTASTNGALPNAGVK